MSNPNLRFQLPFRNRVQAGQLLARVLNKFAGRKDAIVLGLPRGGVTVAAEVARELQLPLDVFIVRKLGVPGHEELAMGAIASGGTALLNYSLASSLGVPESAIHAVIDREYLELQRRENLYRAGRGKLELDGRTVLLIDDGIATGASVIAAVRAVRELGAAHVVIGTPVVATDIASALRSEADELISAIEPEDLDGVGLWYEDFRPLSDKEVLEALKTPVLNVHPSI